MRYVRFGNSQLDVSRLGLDCHSLGVVQRERGWDPISYDGQVFAIRTVHAALDAGINILDTSPDAGGGRAESLLGKALRGRRQGVLLSSTISGGQDALNFKYSIVASMRRLRTDRIDIVYIRDTLFRCDEYRDQQYAELERLRARGDVGHVGLLVTRPTAALKQIESGPFQVAQLQCGNADHGAASEVMEACHKKGLGISVVKSLDPDALKRIVGALEPSRRARRVGECCFKYLLGDRRVHMINVGMRWEHEVAQNAMMFSNLDTDPELPGPATLTTRLGVA